MAKHNKNKETHSFLNENSDIQVKCNLSQIIEERGITMTELSHLTNIRNATLSQLLNDKRENINFDHIVRIAKALRITDLNDIIQLDMSEETKEQFDEEREEIENVGGLTPEQSELIKEERRKAEERITPEKALEKALNDIPDEVDVDDKDNANLDDLLLATLEMFEDTLNNPYKYIDKAFGGQEETGHDPRTFSGLKRRLQTFIKRYRKHLDDSEKYNIAIVDSKLEPVDFPKKTKKKPSGNKA